MDSEQSNKERRPLSKTSTPSRGVAVELQYAPRVNLAMQQYGVPLVQRVSVTNHRDTPLTAVEVRIALSNDEVPPWMGRIERLDVGATYHLEPKEIGLDAQRQAARIETEKCDRASPALPTSRPSRPKACRS